MYLHTAKIIGNLQVEIVYLQKINLMKTINLIDEIINNLKFWFQNWNFIQLLKVFLRIAQFLISILLIALEIY